MKKRIYEKGRNYISISQYTTAKACNLKWYLKNVAYVKYAQSGGAELGSAWHTLVEDWMQKKDIEPLLIKNPTFKRLFDKNGWFFDFLSNLKGVQAEKSIDYELDSKTICIGDIDLVLPDTRLVVDTEVKVSVKEVEGYTTILDWKTMSSWNYALDSEKLSRDDQCLLYGKSQKDTKELVHVQINHRESEIRFVQAPFNRDKAIIVEGNVNAMAIEMESLRKQEISHIKKNRNHCSAYGGCPNLPYCNGKESLVELKERVKPKESLSNQSEVTERLDGLRKELNKPILEKEKKMGFAEMLAAKKANALVEANKQLKETVMPVAPKVETVAVPVVVEVPVVVKDKKIKKVKASLPVEPDTDIPVELPFEEPTEIETEVSWKSVKKVMASIVCIGCAPINHDYVQPVELFKEEIKAILKVNNIQCLAESKFNEAVKSLYKIQDQIKDELKKHAFIYIDRNRQADNTVLDMLYNDDRFIILGGKF